MILLETIKNRLTSGSSFKIDVLWTLMTQLIVMLLAFGITKVASNILTVEKFGQYNVVRRSVSVISFVMLGGMGITLPRYLAMYQGARQYRKMLDLICCSLIFVGVICLLVVAICAIESKYLIQVITGGADNYLYWFAIAFSLSTTISSLLVAYYRGVNDFKNYSITQVSFQFLLFISLFFVPRQNVSVIFLMWFAMTGLFTIIYFLYVYARNRKILFRSFRPYYFVGMMRTIAVYSSPRLVGDFFLFSFSAFPVIYLSHVLSMADVAFYSVGLTIINMATPVFSFLGLVLLPYVSGAISNGQFKNAQVLIRKLSIWYVLLALAIIIVFWIFMPYIIRLFFSPDYILCKDISRTLLLSVLPQSLYLLYRNPIDAVSTFPFNTLILFVCCIVLFLLFYISKTLSDYACSFVCASLVQGVLSMFVWMIIKRNK